MTPRPSDGTSTRGHVSPRHVWVAATGLRHESDPGVLLGEDVVDGRRMLLVFVASGGGMTAARGAVEWVEESRVSPV